MVERGPTQPDLELVLFFEILRPVLWVKRRRIVERDTHLAIVLEGVEEDGVGYLIIGCMGKQGANRIALIEIGEAGDATLADK